MTIENLRVMNEHNAERLAVAPGGQGGGTPAAGASPHSIPEPSPTGNKPITSPHGDIDFPLTSGMDRRDRETEHGTSSFTSSMRHPYSIDVPCPPHNTTMNCIPILDHRLHYTDRYGNHSALIEVFVDMSNSVLNT